MANILKEQKYFLGTRNIETLKITFREQGNMAYSFKGIRKHGTPLRGPRKYCAPVQMYVRGTIADYLTMGLRRTVILKPHYENTPIQIYRKFHLQNLNIFK